VSRDREIEHPRSLREPIEARPLARDLSILIPTLGRPILETCLRYIADGTRWPAAVIVVDQGREPSVADMMRRLAEIGIEAHYVASSQRGRSAGLNRGLEQVTTRFVAITDDDCFVSSDWVEQMEAHLEAEPRAIFTGRVAFAGNPEAAFSVHDAPQPRRYDRPLLKLHPFIGGNAGLGMDVVATIGGFDEDPSIASAEDSDYGHRALRLGFPIVYAPEILLHHYHWRDAGERVERYAEYARSQGGFYGKHLRRGDALVALQALRGLVRSPWRWLRGILRRDRELIVNGRESTRHLGPGIAAGLRNRGERETLALRASRAD
jgi:GT2 family glycosyltransferase